MIYLCFFPYHYNSCFHILPSPTDSHLLVLGRKKKKIKSTLAPCLIWCRKIYHMFAVPFDVTERWPNARSTSAPSQDQIHTPFSACYSDKEQKNNSTFALKLLQIWVFQPLLYTKRLQKAHMQQHHRHHKAKDYSILQFGFRHCLACSITWSKQSQTMSLTSDNLAPRHPWSRRKTFHLLAPNRLE
jgi:hypothetical protein